MSHVSQETEMHDYARQSVYVYSLEYSSLCIYHILYFILYPLYPLGAHNSLLLRSCSKVACEVLFSIVHFPFAGTCEFMLGFTLTYKRLRLY
jgi:hypothetical protein